MRPTAERFIMHGNYGGLTLNREERFLIRYVEDAGLDAYTIREVARTEEKPNLTAVTTADLLNQKRLKVGVRRLHGRDVPIHDEEGEAISPGDLEILYVNDPLDGSGQFAAKYRHPITGKPIRPGAPIPPGAIEIQDHERDTCVGTMRFERGVLTMAAVYDPYHDELFFASTRLGASFLNGHRLDLSQTPDANLAFGPGIPYDFASWRGSLVDPRHLRRDLGRAPNGKYSAIRQGCDVANGHSKTSILTGDTLHDFTAALIVKLANGVVSDIYGNPIDWNNPRGMVCSVNSEIHEGIIAAINVPRIDGLPPGYSPVGKNAVTAEEVLNLRQQAAFGTERRLSVWQDALERTHAFVGARDKLGELVVASFLTGSARHGTMHDLVVHPDHRWLGLGSYAIDKRLKIAEDYRTGGEQVGMAYIDVDLSASGRVIPLGDYYESLGFAVNSNTLTRDYRHTQQV